MNRPNKEQTLGLVRHILTYLGGAIVATGVGITEDMWTQAVGAIITLIGLYWSYKAPEKKKVEE